MGRSQYEIDKDLTKHILEGQDMSDAKTEAYRAQQEMEQSGETAVYFTKEIRLPKIIWVRFGINGEIAETSRQDRLGDDWYRFVVSL